MNLLFIYLKPFLLLVLLLALSNCSNTGTGLPSTDERLAIESGKKVVVLFKVVLDLTDGTRVQSYRCGPLPDDGKSRNQGYIHFYVGFAKSPIFGGELGPEFRITRFLSPESCREGWSFLVMEPGRYFFVFHGERDTDLYTWNKYRSSLPRWQVDIPKSHPVIYIGTLYLTCWSKRNCDYYPSMAFITNEEDQAFKLNEKYFGNTNQMLTQLMKRL